MHDAQGATSSPLTPTPITGSGDGLCTLGYLLTHPALQLVPIECWPASRSRVVESAQIIVGMRDLDGLGRNELALVVGTVPSSAQEAADLAAKAAEVGVAAVALPESYDGAFRQDLVGELSSRHVPVLEVPQTTRYADLIDTVNRFQTSPDAVRFNKMLTMQQSLVASLGPEEPVPTLLARLGRISGGGVGLVSASGEVLGSEGVLPFRLLLEEIGGSRFPEAEVRASGWNALAVRFDETASRPARWLIVGGRREGFVSSFVRAAARVAASLIDAADRIDALVANQDQAVRSSVLGQLLELKPYDNPDVLAERAASLGLVFAREVRVLDIVRFGPKAKGNAAQSLEERISRALVRVGANALVCRRRTSAAVLVEAEPAVRDQALAVLLAEDSGLVVGLGRAISHVREVRESHYDAVLALQQARLQPGTRVFGYDDFKFTTRLIAHVGLERMAEWSRDLIGPLSGKPILLEGLDAFFEAELDVMAAAKALHIHHNSLRYRLQKIEELVGGSLRSPEVIASVQLARMAERATAAADVGPRRLIAPKTGIAKESVASESPVEGSDAESFTGLGAILPD